MEKADKVIDALHNCINRPKCADCPWEECEIEHIKIEIPLSLAYEAMKLLENAYPYRKGGFNDENNA